MNDSNYIKAVVVGIANDRKSALYKRIGEALASASLPHHIEWTDIEDPEDLVPLQPDVVLQVADCTDLEESLVLTPQLIDMHLKLVLALDRYPQFLATKHSLDYQRLGDLMGLQAAPTDLATGEGVDRIARMLVAAVENRENASRHIHVEYGTDVEEAIDDIRLEVAKISDSQPVHSKRYLSIRLLERPEVMLARLSNASNLMALAYTSEKNRRKLEKELHRSPADIIHEARHGFISGALNETLHHSHDSSDHTVSQRIDALLTNRWLGFPLLIVLLYLVFQCTFTLGAYPQEWIQMGVDWLCNLLRHQLPAGWLSSLLVDGIIQGVGAVLSFLPNIIILFLFISLMEDTGYMSRVAFLMDKIMHKVGLHGRSFVPMLVGFGCNVPAIMAASSIPDRKDRTLTMLMIPFMSCGARLPVYMLFVSAFFREHQALVMISLYLIGVLLSILFALIMKRTRYFRKPVEDYVSELPAFRAPVLRNTAAHIWERCADYLKKISTVILWASIIIWALYYFPRNEELTTPYEAQIGQLRQQQAASDVTSIEMLRLDQQIDSLVFERDAVQKEHSALASVGRWMSPVMEPLGFDWRMNVCILTGLPAKEAIVSTMGILYHQQDDAKLEESLRANPSLTPLKAYAFMLFVLLYFPCVATIATLRRQLGRGWAAFTVVHSLVLAWVLAFAVFQIGQLF